ncbi:MAG: vanadium-dependent haloperoxidase [Saprospiraceae bacterium]|nr:vanadium-dependent haloperoxidase [Saprospiraceae bacterium]
MKLLILLFFSLCFIYSCNDLNETRKIIFGTEDLNLCNRKLLEVAMEDAFPPPVASRVYVYPHIAHYITLQSFYPDSLTEITSRLNGFDTLTVNEKIKSRSNPELAALLSFCYTAKDVVFSEYQMVDMADLITQKAKVAGLSNSTIENSIKYAKLVSDLVSKRIKSDEYSVTRTLDRFTSDKRPGKWRETPPDYIAGLEPHWMKIKPLIIDSAGIYPAKSPPRYETSKNSEFYKMVSDVHSHSLNLDSTMVSIAWFWDDNPNVSEHTGHAMTVTHKISPPGHWLNIIHQISSRENSDLFKTTKAYTFSAIAMFDGIISCWYEKYKTNLVRPVTYIQENIDPEWKPLIQTPPFPEYTSGHSVISASAAEVLTDIFGKNFVFRDSTQTLFGMDARDYNSFHVAAWEVSMSRFYGGIHYRQGVEEGNKQGIFIGRYVLSDLTK